MKLYIEKLFQALFRNTIYELQAAGLLYKLREDVMQSRREVPPPRYRVNQPLIMTQLAGAAAIMVIGLLLSVMIFLNELISTDKISTMRKKKKKDMLFQKREMLSNSPHQ